MAEVTRDGSTNSVQGSNGERNCHHKKKEQKNKKMPLKISPIRHDYKSHFVTEITVILCLVGIAYSYMICFWTEMACSVTFSLCGTDEISVRRKRVSNN